MKDTNEQPFRADKLPIHTGQSERCSRSVLSLSCAVLSLSPAQTSCVVSSSLMKTILWKWFSIPNYKEKLANDNERWKIQMRSHSQLTNYPFMLASWSRTYFSFLISCLQYPCHNIPSYNVTLIIRDGISKKVTKTVTIIYLFVHPLLV